MIAKKIAKLKDAPVEFVKKILGATPDEWQAETLTALATNSRVAIRSGHGVGKTTLESWAVLWFLFTRPFCKVPCTAPTIQQLYKILWSELDKWIKRSPMLVEMFEWTKTELRFRDAPARWLALARTAAKPENLAGFHDDHLLFVLDEASGIDDSIFEAVEGALTGSDNKLLMCGNPTRNSGFFKRAFFEDRELYFTKKVSSGESARVSSDYCRRLIKSYGEDSDVVRVRVLGEFPKTEADGLIPLELVEAAAAREADLRGELVIGVDVARFGNDETVLQPRLGNAALPFESYRKADTMATVGRVLNLVERLMKEKNCARAGVNVDDTGVGGGVTDRLREVLREKNLRVTVTACNNGAKPRDAHYSNWGSESYFNLRERFVAGEISIPRDDELIAQLTARKYTVASNGKLTLERKDEFKKRIGRSPDRADALALAFVPTTTRFTIPEMPMQQSYWLS